MEREKQLVKEKKLNFIIGLGVFIITIITILFVLYLYFVPTLERELIVAVLGTLIVFLFLILYFIVRWTKILSKSIQEKMEEMTRFKQAVDNSTDHIVITDAEGIVFYANSAVEKTTGYTLKEVIGSKAGKLWGGYMSKKFYKKMWETIKVKKQVYRGEIANVRKGGEKYFADVTIVPAINSRGTVEFFVGVERDVTDTKLAEEQVRMVLNNLQEKSQILAEEKAKDEALFAGIGEGVITTNQDGEITMINDTALKLLGYDDEDDLKGKILTDKITMVNEKGRKVPISKRLVVLAIARGEKSKTPLGKTYFYKKKNGDTFPLDVTVTPYVYNGRVIGTIEVFKDKTVEYNIDKAKTEFVSLASHQLRTPLSTISWYTEMLLDGDAGKINKEQKKFLDYIQGGSQRMIDLVNALLNVSRLELGTFVVEPEPVDIYKIANDALSELEPKVVEKKIKVNIDFDKTIKKYNADPKLILIVFQNLFSNAVKYTPEKGVVDISISKDKEYLNIAVKDTGFGIPKNQQKNIFTKLFRAENVREKNVDGTGLGLYIVKSIIEHSGGKVWFDSIQDEGTTFYVKLPVLGMVAKKGTKKIGS